MALGFVSLIEHDTSNLSSCLEDNDSISHGSLAIRAEATQDPMDVLTGCDICYESCDSPCYEHCYSSEPCYTER
jgi:hypothetical protein